MLFEGGDELRRRHSIILFFFFFFYSEHLVTRSTGWMFGAREDRGARRASPVSGDGSAAPKRSPAPFLFLYAASCRSR